MAQSGLYLGNVSDMASNLGSMFGPSTQGSTVGNMSNQPSSVAPQAQSVTGSNAGTPGQAYSPIGGATNPVGGNPTINAQAVRPTSFGNFDPQYAQNLSSFIGQSFLGPQSGKPLTFNPFGNLTDMNVPYSNLGGGNAPLPGLPTTLQQYGQQNSQQALYPQPTGAQGSIIGYNNQNSQPIYAQPGSGGLPWLAPGQMPVNGFAPQGGLVVQQGDVQIPQSSNPNTQIYNQGQNTQALDSGMQSYLSYLMNGGAEIPGAQGG